MALHVAAAALAFLVGAWMLWRITPQSIRRAIPTRDHRHWMLSTLPLALVKEMQVVNRQASIVLLGFFVADAQIGVYRVAAQVSLFASFGLQAVNVVVSPRFARLHAQGDLERLQRLATTSARAVLAFNAVVTLALAVMGRPFLSIVFGPEYEAAYWPMLILLGGQLVNSAAGSVGSLLNMTGHERDTARSMVFAAVCNVALNLALIPIVGIAGAAIGTAVSLVVWNVMLWWAVRRRLGIRSTAIAGF
jgi:O-antigen/teichoic acid export membrane protein